MEKVPQIVRERLRVAMPLVNHPDADVLTAFAERSLPELERAIVLEHLARCGDCREVVALALPEFVPVTAQTARSRSGWLTWPALRWGFAVAGVAVVASLGVVRYRHQTAPGVAGKDVTKFVSLAKNDAVASLPAATVKEPAPAAAGKQQTKIPSASLAKSEMNEPVASLKKKLRDEASVAGLVASGRAAGAGTLGGPLPHGPRVAYQNQSNQWQTQNNFVANAPPPPTAAPATQQAQSQSAVSTQVPAQTQTVRVDTVTPVIETQNLGGGNLDLPNQPISTPPADDGYAESRVEKSKSGETALTVGPTKVLAGSPPAGSQLDYLSTPPRWAITSSGTLQRSYDQGTSWQDVPVKSSPGGAVSGMMMVAREAASPSKPAAPAKAKDTAKQGAAVDTPILFRAVAAIGNEVWAGGTAGRLYHSSDAGSHWMQVVPSSGNVALSGDIVTLDFSDAQHGRVMTSTREIWLTTDAGQTWQKQ